tara:strand:- start:81 stop:302 length:222 start_codon:yes stop_codon:yes gene_type:complete
MVEYPTIKILDLALYLKHRIEIIDLNESRDSFDTHVAAKKEIDLIKRQFPKINQCLDYIDNLEKKEIEERSGK